MLKKITDIRRLSNVVKRNVCHRKQNKAVITQMGERTMLSLFIFSSRQRRLVCPRIRNKILVRSAFMRTAVLFFYNFFIE